MNKNRKSKSFLKLFCIFKNGLYKYSYISKITSSGCHPLHSVVDMASFIWVHFKTRGETRQINC